MFHIKAFLVVQVVGSLLILLLTGSYTLMSPVVVDLKKIFFMPNNKDVENDGGNLITLASRHLVYWVRELVDKQMGCSRNVQRDIAQNCLF